jgi:tetratricopeptide (TPR) repeat protein
MQSWRQLSRLAAVVFLAWLPFAHQACAQVLEDVEIKREGAGDAVVTIRFGMTVQYLRTATSPRKDLIQVFFRITEIDDSGGRTFEEFRRAPANDLTPPFTVTYPMLTGSATRRLDIQFTKPVTARVRPGPDNRSIQIVMPALTPAPRPEPVPAPKPAAKPGQKAVTAPPPVSLPAEIPAAAAPAATDSAVAEIQKKSADLLIKARAAFDAGNSELAVDLLNQLLNLPPNAASREAQELIGIARERRGEIVKARAEYELFLKLYTEGADVNRVKLRLAGLNAASPAIAATPAKPAASAPEPPKAPTKLVWGSVSQYYYGGKSQSQTDIITVTPATNATTIDTLSLSGKDQSALVTNIDLNARYTSSDWDDRMVFRDTQTTSFLSTQPNRNRLISLYADLKYLPGQLFARFGRQAATTSSGALGRFDGAQIGYGFAPGFRINAIAGTPAETFTGTKPVFYGLSLDAEKLADRWNGTFYAIQQRVDSMTDRNVLGTELRYFDTQRTLLSLIDYDVTFRALNIGMVQGTWQLPSGTAFNLLLDYRRSPSLQLSNALLTGTNLTLRELLDTFSAGDVRTQATAVTPISKVFYVGATYPISPVWQLGADVRISSLTGTPEIGLLPATPSTGNVYTYSVQLIGSGLFARNDVMVLNGSYLTGQLNKGLSLGLTERVQFLEKWVFEPSLKYYKQKDIHDVDLTRTSPGFKLSYRLQERIQLESEVTIEKTRTVSPTVNDESTRRFYFLGYRWDF